VRHNVVLVVVVVVFVMVVVVAVIVVLVLVTVDVVVRVVVVTVVVVKVGVVVVTVFVDVGKKGRCTFVRPLLIWPQRLPTPPVSSPLPALASLRSSFKPFAKRLESSLGTRKALLPAGGVQSQAPTTTTTNTLTRPVNHHNRREPTKIRSGMERSV
jgi:hypothetical protein